MNRPPSIVLFERLYLGSLALSLVGALVFWTQNQATALANPQVQTNPVVAGLIPIITVATLVIVTAVSLLFWWLVARQRSEVGKWLVVVTEALGVLFALFALYQLVSGAAVTPAASALNLVVTALGATAAAMLFRPDVRGWFGDEGEAPRP